MNESSELVIEAARSRVGLPFRHHYRPKNACVGGTVTIGNCLTRGVDDEGYDCSGLIVASICEARSTATEDWPRSFRHLKQMEILAGTEQPQPGDTLLFYEYPIDDRPVRTHLGIFVAKHQVIHANGISGFVDEGEVQGVFEKIRTIPLRHLFQLLDVQESVSI